MIARYVRRIVRKPGEVVVTMSCGHQRFFTAVEWWERVKDHERFFGEETVAYLPCPECIKSIAFVKGPKP